MGIETPDWKLKILRPSFWTANRESAFMKLARAKV